MSDYNNNSLIPSGSGTPSPTTPSRVTGAVAGAIAGAVLPLGPVGWLAGAVVGGVFGPRVKVVNSVSEKAMQQLGKWAGR